MLGSIIGLGTAALGSIWGAVASKRSMDSAKSTLAKSNAEQQAWYNRQIAQDYTQRTDIQALLSKQRDLLNEQYRRARATNVVAGGTDEGLAMQKQAANQSLAQTMSSIGANAANYREGMELGKMQGQANYNNQVTNLYDRQAQMSAQAGAQLASVGGEFIDADGNWDWLLKKRKKNEGEA